MSKKSETTCIQFLLDLLISLWKSQPHSTSQLLSPEQVSDLGVITLPGIQLDRRICKNVEQQKYADMGSGSSKISHFHYFLSSLSSPSET